VKAYLLANVRIDDRQRFEHEYRPRARAALEKFGARVLVPGGTPEPVEGAWALDRVVVMELDDLETAHAGHWDISLLHGYDDGRPDVAGDAPAYFVGNTELVGEGGIERHLKEWAPLAHPALERNGGKVIAVSRSDMVISTSRNQGPPYPTGGADPPELIEGDWKLHRVLLHRYPSIERARAFVTSPEWIAGQEIRAAAGRYDVVLLNPATSPREPLL
jgi:uncharacterized protein (DUF1330 family)